MLNSFYGSDIYNGKEINLRGISGIKRGLKTPFNLSSDADLGDSNVYNITSTSSGEKYKIFNPAENEMAFALDYSINDIVVVHNDVAELYFNIFSDELTESVKIYKLIVNIPDNVEMLKAWAHGPLNGNIEIIDKNKVEVTINTLYEKEEMDIRLVFDKSVVSESNKNSNVDALENILAVEQERADEANNKREIIKEENEFIAKQCVEEVERNLKREQYDSCVSSVDFLTEGELKDSLNERLDICLVKIEKKEKTLLQRWFGFLGLWALSLVIFICYAYIQHDKEYRPSFKHKYFRDFPNDYGPEVVKYLMYKNIDGQSLSSAIVNLISKKVIDYEAVEDDYKLVYHPERKLEQELTESEKVLLDWFFNKIVVDNDVTLKEIKNASKKRYNSFLSNYKKWKDAVEKECESYNFFEEKTSIRLAIVAMSLLGLIFLIWTPNNPSAFKTIFLIVIIVFSSLLYGASISKRTISGNEEYAKWKALSNFLYDFGNFKDRDLPHISLWEKYLVYAMVFGCAKELNKTMKIKIDEMDINNQNSAYVTHIIHMRTINNMTSLINGTIISSVSAATNARNAASSGNSSSGFGAGGGFSSGGGFGGGGGGGGRF